MDKAELIQVIRTTLTRRGEGRQGSPIRVITQFWTLDGQLLAEVDPCDKRLPGPQELMMVNYS